MTKLIRTSLPKKGKPKRDRRYPIQRFPIYDQTFDLKMKRSPVLNKERRESDIRNAGMLLDVRECEKTLMQLVGNPNKDFHYLEADKWVPALIPIAQLNLRKIHSAFKQWQKKQVLEGFALEKPTKWPNDLLEKRLKAEAILDVYRQEKKAVEIAIKAYNAEKEEKRKKKILEFGPQGKGLNHDPRSGHPWLVDGQKVGSNEEGIPFIDEPSSKYDGMPLVFYRKMASAWREAQRQKSSNWRRIKVSKDEMPEWPENAKPISEIELQSGLLHS